MNGSWAGLSTFLNLGDITSAAVAIAQNTQSAAWSILFVTAPLAYGLVLARHAVGGRPPFSVVLHLFGLAITLALYTWITTAIYNFGVEFSTTVAPNHYFQQLLNMGNGNGGFFSAGPVPSESPGLSNIISNLVDLASGVMTGTLSYILRALGMFVVVLVLHVYQIVQTVLYGVLVAIGPLCLAVSILPGAGSIAQRWLTGLFELALWPIVAAIILELLGHSFLTLQITDDFVSLFACDIVLVFCVCLVPRICSRLVGSGFGAIGDMMQRTALAAALAPARAAASAVAPGVTQAAQAAGTLAAGAVGPYVTPVLAAASNAWSGSASAASNMPSFAGLNGTANGGFHGGAHGGVHGDRAEGMAPPPNASTPPSRAALAGSQTLQHPNDLANPQHAFGNQGRRMASEAYVAPSSHGSNGGGVDPAQVRKRSSHVRSKMEVVSAEKAADVPAYVNAGLNPDAPSNNESAIGEDRRSSLENRAGVRPPPRPESPRNGRA